VRVEWTLFAIISKPTARARAATLIDDRIETQVDLLIWKGSPKKLSPKRKILKGTGFSPFGLKE